MYADLPAPEFEGIGNAHMMTAVQIGRQFVLGKPAHFECFLGVAGDCGMN